MMTSVLKRASLNVQKASRCNLKRGTSYAISVCASRVFVQQQLSRRPHVTPLLLVQLLEEDTNTSERSLTRGLRPALPVTVLDVSISYSYRINARILK